MEQCCRKTLKVYRNYSPVHVDSILGRHMFLVNDPKTHKYTFNVIVGALVDSFEYTPIAE